MRAGLLPCALVLLPLGVAYGQRGEARARYAAMQERLEAAVEAGEISQGEADRKLASFGRKLRESLRDGRQAKKQQTNQDLKAEYEAVKKKLAAAVEAGEMTPEEGRKKLVEIRKRMFKKE